MLLPGNFNTRSSVSACRGSCQTTRGCNAWIYCRHPRGCDDGREYHPDWYPYQVRRFVDV